MFTLGPATRVFLALGPTDMRKSFDTLFALARDHIGVNPLSGHLFVFCNQRHNRLKILYWDGSGLWVCAKRLPKGTFHWPKAQDPNSPSITLRQEQLSLLLSGFDLANTRERPWWRKEIIIEMAEPNVDKI